MRILLIEDEIPAANRLASLLKEILPSAKIIDVLDSIESAVKWFKIHQNPDLIIMDIHLADGNSFMIFEQVDIKSPVIFATAYDEYAIKAFKVNSIDYLLKPIEKAELEIAVHKFNSLSAKNEAIDFKLLINTLKSDRKEYKQRFLVKIADRLVPVNAADVCYFFAEDKLVFLQTRSNIYQIDFTLDQLEEILDPVLFFRLNRKFLGQAPSINKIFNHLNGKLKIVLDPAHPEDLFVSRERASEFKNWLEK